MLTLFQKQFKIAEKVFDEYEEQLRQIFKFFSKRGKSASFGIEDVTLEVDDLINLFKKTDLLDGNKLMLQDLIAAIEKYYAPETKLEYKLQEQNFQTFLKNQTLQKSQQAQRELEASKKTVSAADASKGEDAGPDGSA